MARAFKSAAAFKTSVKTRMRTRAKESGLPLQTLQPMTTRGRKNVDASSRHRKRSRGEQVGYAQNFATEKGGER
jgi:hypothetical protein